jgi:hypothetical protein
VVLADSKAKLLEEALQGLALSSEDYLEGLVKLDLPEGCTILKKPRG